MSNFIFIEAIKNDPASILIYRDRRFVLTMYRRSGLAFDADGLRFRLSKVRGVRSVVDEFKDEPLPENVAACLSFNMSNSEIRDQLIDMVILDHSLLLDFDSEVTTSGVSMIEPDDNHADG